MISLGMPCSLNISFMKILEIYISLQVDLMGIKWACHCFMETCTGDLAKSYTNKAYQEKEERYNMKNENQCIL
jgi:hypothetical protein